MGAPKASVQFGGAPLIERPLGAARATGLEAGAVLRVPDNGGSGAAQPMQQVAVNPPPAQPSYQQPSNIPSTHQPTIINGPNNGGGSNYTQVTTRNANRATSS